MDLSAGADLLAGGLDAGLLAQAGGQGLVKEHPVAQPAEFAPLLPDTGLLEPLLFQGPDLGQQGLGGWL